MPNILTLETNKYAIKIDNFEGPLDLLCHLIDKNKFDIYDINLNDITDQYIEYIKAMEEMDLEITSEFLLMASNLLYIKSRKLLPRQEQDDEMLSEEELLRIWNRFYKVDESRNRENGGNGIGLSLVKAIMNNYGNEYGAKNVENGIEFYFDLDLKE